MKLPLPWLMDYLPETLRGTAWSEALAAACKRWDLEPSKDTAQSLGRLMTFAGFALDEIEGTGETATLVLDVLSNRPDAQCIVGLAREVAAILHVELKNPPVDCQQMESGEPANALAKVEVEDAKLCPRYTARVIRVVKVAPSPKWLQDRLISLGLQPRNNIVDVTNFICFELNQPLHAFDLAGLSGRKIVVRRAREKEPFTPLYGEIPPLTTETLVIADAERPRAIAGVLGGKGSEVTPETTEILLEAACFEPANTRRTVRRLKVMDGRGTDSSYRFERGVDVENVARASARAARLIVEVAGGQIAPGIIDVWPAPPAQKTIELHLAQVQRIFGAPVPKEEAARSLVAIGAQITAESSTSISVKIPSWRRGDLEREIDLVEEVARLYGYNHVPAETAMRAKVPARSNLEIAGELLRTLLTSLGYFEITTDSLIDPKWPDASVWTTQKPLPLDKASVLREDHSAVRNALLPSMLAVRLHNQNHRTGEARLFEIGKAFVPAAQFGNEGKGGKGGDERPEEKLVLGIVDDRGFQALSDSLRRVGEALELSGAHLKFSDGGTAPTFFKPGHAAHILRVREMPGDERAEDAIGWVGVIAPSLQQAFGLRKSVAVAELDFRALAALPRAPRRYSDLPSYPEIARDTAIVVDESVTWEDVRTFVQRSQESEPLRDKNEAPRFLSVFRGEKIGAGKKSIAFSIQYRAAGRTLTDEEVEAAHTKFQQALLQKFNATLRI